MKTRIYAAPAVRGLIFEPNLSDESINLLDFLNLFTKLTTRPLILQRPRALYIFG